MKKFIILSLVFFMLCLSGCGSNNENNNTETNTNTNTTSNIDYSYYYDGDWYGWWTIQNGKGMHEGATGIAWDAFANISVNGDIGTFTMWDTETSRSVPIIKADVTFDDSDPTYGSMLVNSGYFFASESWLPQFDVKKDAIDANEWIVNPSNSTVSKFDHMIEIRGNYVSPANNEDSFTYVIFLKPWKYMWDDVKNGDTNGCLFKDMMPLYYDNWYTSLMNIGTEKMPDSFKEGITIIEDYIAANNNSNTNNNNEAPSNVDLGPKEGADGYVALDKLYELLPYMKKAGYETTYDEIAQKFGAHGKSIDSLFENRTIYRWWADDENYIQITFATETGTELWNVTTWSGLK